MPTIRNNGKYLTFNTDITAAPGSAGDVVPCQGFVSQTTVVNTSAAGIEYRLGSSAWKFLGPNGSAFAEFDPAIAGVALRLVNDGSVSASAEVTFQRADVPRTYDRAPGNDDNASVGYTTDSVWQAGGDVFQPVKVDVGSALWTKVPVAKIGFVDVLGAANTASAFGTVAMKTGFTGPAVDISVMISGTPTTFTLNILADGELDQVSAFAAVGQADAGTYPVCTKAYDQSGAANHWVAAAPATAPYFVFDQVEQRFGLTTGGPSGAPRTLTVPDAHVVTGNAYTVFSYGRGNASAANNNNAALYVLGRPGAPRYTSGVVIPGGRFSLAKYGGSNAHGSVIVPIDTQAHVMMVVSGPSTLMISANEIVNSFVPSYGNDTGTFVGASMFCYDPASNNSASASHIVFGFGVGKVAATAAQQKVLRYSAYARFDIRPQVLDQIFMIGDSRTNIAHPVTQPFDNMAHRLAAILGKQYRIYNYGLYGARCDEFLAGAKATIPNAASQYNPAARNAVTFLGGVNDASAGDSPEQVVAEITACTAPLKAAGYKVLLFNELASTAGASSAKLVAIRRLVAANGAASMNADRIIDMLEEVMPLATPADTAVYSDGLHPTVPTIQAEATVVAANL